MQPAIRSVVVLFGLALGCSSGSAPEANTNGAGTDGGGTSPGSSPGVSGQASGGASAGAAGGGGSPSGAASGTDPGDSAGSAGAGGASGSAGAGGVSSGCDSALAASNKAQANAALDALFVDKDLSAIDQYWADPYLQHNPIAQSGLAAFKSIMSGFVGSPSFMYERLRSLAECDLVVVQGRYSGTGVIFDMFRLKDGKLMEHWDSDANQASSADGLSEISDLPQTSANRSIVLAYLEDDASEHLAADYVDHRNPASDDITYSEVHHLIADGNFVFALSEGELGGTPYGFYDLFRLADGKIVEHWDSRRVVPPSTASGLGIF